MSSMPKQDIAKIAGAAVLLLLAVFMIFHFYQSQQIHVAVQVNAPPGSSEKGQAMKGLESTGDGPSDNIDPTKVKH